MNENQGLPTLAQILAVLKENNGATAMDLHRLMRKDWANSTAEYIANQLRVAMNSGLAKAEHGSNAWKTTEQEVACAD